MISARQGLAGLALCRRAGVRHIDPKLLRSVRLGQSIRVELSSVSCALDLRVEVAREVL
jgi:hypothetical protein